MAIIPTLTKTITLPYTSFNTSSVFYSTPYFYVRVDGGSTSSPTCVVYRTNINTGTTDVVYSGSSILTKSYMSHGAFFVYNDELYFLGTPTYYSVSNINIVNLTKSQTTTTTISSGTGYNNYTYKAYVLGDKVYFSHAGGGNGQDFTSKLCELDMKTKTTTIISSYRGITATETAGYYGSLLGNKKSIVPLPRTSSDYTTTGVVTDRQLINSGNEWYSFRNGYFASIDINTLIETPILNISSGTSPLYFKDSNKYLIAYNGTLSIYDLTDYRITFDFKDNDGSIFETLNDKPPITKINLNYVGVGVTVVITFLDGTEQEIYFEVPQIEGQQFYGLNIVPNAKEAIIVSGDNTIYLSNNTSFYPVYQTYRPPSRTFQLNLYKNTSTPNRVDKTNYITQIGTLYGAFRDETSVTNMAITIQTTDVPTFNYVYIPIFARYYYVTDIRSIRQNLWEISLSVDVLMSYKNAILNCKGFVDRNEFEYSENIIDNKRVIEQGYDVEQSTISNELFDKGLQGDSFVVTGFALKSYSKG